MRLLDKSKWIGPFFISIQIVDIFVRKPEGDVGSVYPLFAIDLSVTNDKSGAAVSVVVPVLKLTLGVRAKWVCARS